MSWSWRKNAEYRGVIELYDDATGRMLAWIGQRPPYCDRGHFQANVECVPDLDSQDGWPRYYMHLEVARRETVDFLRWRLLKERASPHDGVYDMLLKRIEQLMQSDPAPGSADGERLDELVTLCSAYEKLAFPEFATETKNVV